MGALYSPQCWLVRLLSPQLDSMDVNSEEFIRLLKAFILCCWRLKWFLALVGKFIAVPSPRQFTTQDYRTQSIPDIFTHSFRREMLILSYP